jgi:hypothetical protein
MTKVLLLHRDQSNRFHGLNIVVLHSMPLDLISCFVREGLLGLNRYLLADMDIEDIGYEYSALLDRTVVSELRRLAPAEQQMKAAM